MKKSKDNTSQRFSLTYGPETSGDYRDTWQVFRIMAEFVSGYQFLTDMKKAVTVFGSARTNPKSTYYREAEKFGEMLGKNGYAVVTGGGPGIMEAANKGAHDVKADSVGLNIQLPYEQRINKYVNKSIAFHYFFSRKAMLSAPASAVVFFPGGFGTLDEFFEIWDSMELHLINRVPFILVGKEFWKPLLDFLKNNTFETLHSIEAKDLKLLTLVDSPEEALKIVRAHKPRANYCSYLSPTNFYCDQKINWRIFQIMAEVVTGFEFLTGITRDVTVLGTKSIKPESPYYMAAYELGRKLARKKYTVITGGGSGVMEAANKGAYEVGGDSIGLYTKTSPVSGAEDQGPVNSYLTRSLSFQFSYVRKLILTAPSKAFVLFPGGLGTMDQCFEVLTLIQTKKMPAVPIILFGKEYWQPMLEFLKNNVFEEKHAVTKHDLHLFHVVEKVEGAMRIIEG